ncbi:conserved hypothetical protein, partial [Ricinus communis]
MTPEFPHLSTYNDYRKQYTRHLLKEPTYYAYLARARCLIRKAASQSGVNEFPLEQFESFAAFRPSSDNGEVTNFVRRVIRYMEEQAENYSSDHWRLLRKCLETYCRALGQPALADEVRWKDKAAKKSRSNPALPANREGLIGRATRAKLVKPSDFMKIYNYFAERADSENAGKRTRAHQ